MQVQGLPPSAEGVARLYSDFLDVLVVDERDAHAAARLEAMGRRVLCAKTMMKSMEDKAALAQAALEATLQAQPTR